MRKYFDMCPCGRGNVQCGWFSHEKRSAPRGRGGGKRWTQRFCFFIGMDTSYSASAGLHMWIVSTHRISLEELPCFRRAIFHKVRTTLVRLKDNVHRMLFHKNLCRYWTPLCNLLWVPFEQIVAYLVGHVDICTQLQKWFTNFHISVEPPENKMQSCFLRLQ